MAAATRCRRCPRSARATLSSSSPGRDAGKRGTVERVISSSPAGRAWQIGVMYFRRGSGSRRRPAVSVVVEGLDIAKRHTKPRQTQERTDRRQDPAGRDPRARPADRRVQGDGHVPQLQQADPHRPHTSSKRPARARVPPLRQGDRGDGMTERPIEARGRRGGAGGRRRRARATSPVAADDSRQQAAAEPLPPHEAAPRGRRASRRSRCRGRAVRGGSAAEATPRRPRTRSEPREPGRRGRRADRGRDAAEPTWPPSPPRSRSRAASASASPGLASPGPPRARSPPRPAGPRGLQLRYQTDVVPALQKEFGYDNPMQVPRLAKIVVNIGLGEA